MTRPNCWSSLLQYGHLFFVEVVLASLHRCVLSSQTLPTVWVNEGGRLRFGNLDLRGGEKFRTQLHCFLMRSDGRKNTSFKSRDMHPMRLLRGHEALAGKKQRLFSGERRAKNDFFVHEIKRSGAPRRRARAQSSAFVKIKRSGVPRLRA